MTLDTALAAIKVAGRSPGGIGLIPLFDPNRPAFQATWYERGAASTDAFGDTEQDAFDNLLLVLQGKAGVVEKRLRLREAQAKELAAQSDFALAVAEREAIEAEVPR